jgi:hypothetical protein
VNAQNTCDPPPGTSFVYKVEQNTCGLLPSSELSYTLDAGELDVISGYLNALDVRTANFPVLDVREYGLVGDGLQVRTCMIVQNYYTVSCTGTNFNQNTDANKLTVFLGAGPGTPPAALITTIQSVQSPTNMTLNASASNSSSLLFYYGTDNYTAWCGNSTTPGIMNCTSQSFNNGLYTPQPGRRIFVPRGAYFFNGPNTPTNGSIGERERVIRSWVRINRQRTL